MADTLWVKAKQEDNRVAMWERDAAHPNGEAFVIGDGKAVEVGDTAMVHERIAQQVLVETKAPAATSEKK